MSDRVTAAPETDRPTASMINALCAAVISAAGAWSALRALTLADGRELLAFGSLAYAAGLTSLRLGTDGASFRLSVPVTLASIPFLGPGASVPAMLAALAEMATAGPDRERLPRALFSVFRRSAAALAGGSTYILMMRGLGPAAGQAFALALVAFALVELAGRFVEESGKSDLRGAIVEYALAGAVGWLIVSWRHFCPGYIMVYGALAAIGVHLASVAVAKKPQPEVVQPAPLALEIAPVEAEPERLSLVDPLTGAANDRYLYMFLQQEIGRSVRKNLPVSLILLDVDDFESINDTHGRDSADAALTQIVSLLKTCVREYDIVARYSSDEFAIVLPEAKLSDACDSAERIRASIEHSSFGADLRLRVSLGVATYPEHGLTPDNLVSSAIHALNRAKFEGKNRVTSCHDILGKLKYGT